MRFLYAILLGVLMAGSIASAELEPPRNYIAAMVNETVITAGQVDELTMDAARPLLRTYQQPELVEQKLQALRSEILEQLIENRLILDEFKTGGAKVPEAWVEDEIKDKIRQRYHDRATLTRELQAKGLTQDALRQQIREDIILNLMRHKNIASAILISPQKIERYYSTNLNQFQLGNQVKLRMIVLKCTVDEPVEEVRKRAREITGKLDEGASFAEMAAIYSEGSEQKQGGDLGWMENSKTTKGLADVAAGLRPGQHSDFIGFARDTNDVYWMYSYNKAGQVILARKYSDRIGMNEMIEERKFEPPIEDATLAVPPQEFRLIMLADRRVARTEPLAEVRDKIEKELQSQEHERLRKRWVDRLRAKAFVRYFR